jgi:hypothetical protein
MKAFGRGGALTARTRGFHGTAWGYKKIFWIATGHYKIVGSKIGIHDGKAISRRYFLAVGE